MDRREHTCRRVLIEHRQIHRHGQLGIEIDRRLLRIKIVGLGLIFEVIDQEHGVAFGAFDGGIGNHNE
jgi:hypothetical protein